MNPYLLLIIKKKKNHKLLRINHLDFTNADECWDFLKRKFVHLLSVWKAH